MDVHYPYSVSWWVIKDEASKWLLVVHHWGSVLQIPYSAWQEGHLAHKHPAPFTSKGSLLEQL